MTKDDLVEFLHSCQPRIKFDPSKISGYSDDEIEKIKRLYDIDVTGQLYDFLKIMGRCSGGFFFDDALIFYGGKIDLRTFFLFQTTLREDVLSLGACDLMRNKLFLISIEAETQYFFIPTRGENKNNVYRYDENDEKSSLQGMICLNILKKF